jgi:hypothetical protein
VLDRLNRNIESQDLKMRLGDMADLLTSWRIDNPDEFMSLNNDIHTPLLCWDILEQRDGPDAWVRPKAEAVAEAMREERDNFRKIMDRDPSGDINRALKFCLILHRKGLTYKQRWSATRRFAA